MYQGKASKIPEYLRNLLLSHAALSPEIFYTLAEMVWRRQVEAPVFQHNPFSLLIQHCRGSLAKKYYVLDSFPFLSDSEEVVDSSTFFESNQEYFFFLESLLPGMNAKELVLLLSCD